MEHLWSIYSSFLINFNIGTGLFNLLDSNLYSTSSISPTQQPDKTRQKMSVLSVLRNLPV